MSALDKEWQSCVPVINFSKITLCIRLWIMMWITSGDKHAAC